MSAAKLVGAGYFGARAIEWAEGGKAWFALAYLVVAFTLFYLGREHHA